MDSGYGPGEDFCEDDEPLEDVLAAFGRGVKGKTAKPAVLVEMHGPDGLLMQVSTSAAGDGRFAQEIDCPNRVANSR
jgi:hypothetical protein